LRRVQAGEPLVVTVSGRPVAELRPLAARPAALDWPTFQRRLQQARPDRGLAADLRALAPDSTDDLPSP
jgi:prevent-host-death family protein